jgi:predicted enzyme related to lactoylglutathione lyase
VPAAARQLIPPDREIRTAFVVVADRSPYRRQEEHVMASTVVHFEIRSADPDATRAFYGKLFGWTYPDGGIPGYTYVDTGADGAVPGGIGPVQGGEPLVTFFVGVADVAATLDAAAAMGGRIVQPATKVPGVTFGLVADPQGQIVGLASADG